MAVETIQGFNIPKRDLTEEESNRDISFERFDEWQMEVGEDFCDQVGSMVNHYVFGGYLMAKHPELSEKILKIINNKYGDVLSYVSMFEEHFDDEEDANKKFYTLLAEFANLTKVLKKNINQILIQVMESKG
jgi:hypothetical protein